MPSQDIAKNMLAELRNDCLAAAANQLELRAQLKTKRIAVTGGTGFMGTWIAEMVSALNDEYDLGIVLDLYARNTTRWAKKYPHLSSRSDIFLRTQDVRSPFEFQKETHFVIHAAGIPDNRIHSSDPLRVHQTTLLGTANALDAANQLGGLEKLLVVSSGLVVGNSNQGKPISESDHFSSEVGKLHNVYADSKRAAESLASIYRNQFRMPISVIRPFTFIGPYQDLDRPWALNSFMQDAVTGREIRIHGDGSARRSYLYGSDVAWWVLVALIKGQNGGVYNLGASQPLSHTDLIDLICMKASLKPRLSFNTNSGSAKSNHTDDFYPNLQAIQKSLNVNQTCSLEQALDKTWRWHSHRLALSNQ